jgi:hypothetical protein
MKQTETSLKIGNWIYVGTGKDKLQIWYRFIGNNKDIIEYIKWNKETEDVCEINNITLENLKLLKGIEQSIMIRSLGYGK